ncbi:AraC family transcriptional regulator [Sphingobacterium sp. SGG-5]|uniref:AraC family transcriptional regulator n=1 Tax=Sphingobacterium sp. SGG-5 TaxID=2710881 RepID=UPI0013EA97B6|nr:AraC family transcriptional regulator [Sphingobacterium sp. SGG-5]NGM61902.1 AraC family transcriptional regulator [Sphingobacterium sp. SGG-5]
MIKQLNLQSTTFQSFNIRRDSVPKNHNIWHYHEELEFILVIQGAGKLFVGDCIQEFVAGDVILIGANIPHYWLFDPEYQREGEEGLIDCIVVHFRQNCLGNEFMHLPEAGSLRELTMAAQRALHIQLTPVHELFALFQKMMTAEGMLKITALLETLWFFKNSSPNSLISDSYVIINHSDDMKRMNIVMEYIRKNFTHKIELGQLAQLAQMTKNSFSRYFKQKTGKTPMQLIFELRISNACKLLNNPDYALKEICYDSGFNNAVSFHKVFKSITGMTPVQYRHSLRAK